MKENEAKSPKEWDVCSSKSKQTESFQKLLYATLRNKGNDFPAFPRAAHWYKTSSPIG